MFILKAPTFNIKTVSVNKKSKTTSGYSSKKSRLLTGTCIEVDGKYKIQVDLNDKDYGLDPVFEFTKESLDNKGKEYLYCLNNGVLYIHIRTKEESNLIPGDDRWSPVVKGIKCTGYLIRNNILNRLEFQIKITHGYGKENNYNYIDKNKPLYNQ